MTEKQSTPPPTTSQDVASSPRTHNPKRARMTSPEHPADTEAQTADNSTPVHAATSTSDQAEGTNDTTAVQACNVADDDDLEADDADSAFGGSDRSDLTSITSSITQGIIENGRRYQAKREGEYFQPADEKQFVSMEAAHIVNMVLDSHRKNPLFYSPISEGAQNILDVGTGSGIWATEVADRFPSAVVLGVDLSPPPETWVPPNCKFEVDDVLKPWDYQQKFDLIHIRDLFACFSNEQWRLVYKQAYNNLAPGGWIEQFETDIVPTSDDGTLPTDSHLAKWGQMFYPLCEKMGRPADTIDHFKSRIEKAGFINIHEKRYKVPLGDWAKNPVMKEAGSFYKTQFLEGLEGYVMFILTRFGEPTPWTADEVQVFLARVRQEVNNPAYHPYYLKKRVWAQKPSDTKP